MMGCRGEGCENQNRMFLPFQFTPLGSSQVKNTYFKVAGHTPPFSMPPATDLITPFHWESHRHWCPPFLEAHSSSSVLSTPRRYPSTQRVKPDTRHQVSFDIVAAILVLRVENKNKISPLSPIPHR